MPEVGAYHLARNSGNFGLKSNSKVIFRKIRSEIVEYLQRYSSFSVRNGTAEISLPFAKHSSSSLSSAESNYGKSNCKWWAPFPSVGLVILEKPLFNARPNRFILTTGKHPKSPLVITPLKEVWESPRAKENLTSVGFEPTSFRCSTDWSKRPVRVQVGVI